MSFRRTGIGAGIAATARCGRRARWRLPKDWGTNFQPAASPVMEQIEGFHTTLVYIITLISLFVLALLVWIVIRYNKRSNPTPSQVHHNTLLEVVWTVIPVVILVIIAIPSFRLLYLEAVIPKPDVTIKAIGHQWYGAMNMRPPDSPSNRACCRMPTRQRRMSRACSASTTSWSFP